MDKTNQFFPSSYEASRLRFREMLPAIKNFWPQAALHSQSLNGFPDLTIDWITTNDETPVKNMVVFTTGEHGIEGFVGSAMLELFFQRCIPRLDASSTALTLVHAINPWGMKNYRRTNPNNVDLNRNFVWDPSLIEAEFNPQYREIRDLVEPHGEIKNLLGEKLRFLIGYYLKRSKIGSGPLWDAKIMGQYAYPQGIHYGGDQVQEEVALLKSIYRRAFESCERLLHMDMHTGYGPRYQMTVVNSPLESRTSEFFRLAIDYPLVAAMNPDEFYEVRGDMVDYVYMLGRTEFPQVELFATAFEFGTYGISHRQRLRSMQAMVLENQSYWNGASSKSIERGVRRDFIESFYPSDSRWREKALADADRAYRGILKFFDLASD